MRCKPLYPSVFYASIHHVLCAFLGNIKEEAKKYPYYYYTVCAFLCRCACARVCAFVSNLCTYYIHSDECLAIEGFKCNPITNHFLYTATELD